jgi:hypothetical protein
MSKAMRQIHRAVKRYNARYYANCWMPEHNDWRWNVYGVQRRIAQAAISYGGYIVTGTRHYCPIMDLQINSVGHHDLKRYAGGLSEVVQGFTDQYGTFLTRKEAWVIAEAAGQIRRVTDTPGTLYSEDYI